MSLSNSMAILRLADMNKDAKIYVAGHRGMVGSAIVRRLSAAGYTNIVVRDRQQLDLLDQAAVHAYLKAEKPDYIFIAAARVGGIQANNIYRADFIYPTSNPRHRLRYQTTQSALMQAYAPIGQVIMLCALIQ